MIVISTKTAVRATPILNHYTSTEEGRGRGRRTMREAAKAGAAGREEWLGAAAVLRQRAQVTWALGAALEAIVVRAMGGAALGEAEWKGTSSTVRRAGIRNGALEATAPVPYSTKAAASLREGLAETLACQRLGLPRELIRVLGNTNLIGSAFATTEAICHRVRRWRQWCTGQEVGDHGAAAGRAGLPPGGLGRSNGPAGQGDRRAYLGAVGSRGRQLREERPNRSSPVVRWADDARPVFSCPAPRTGAGATGRVLGLGCARRGVIR